MEKKDLKTGMVLELKNESLRLVVDNYLVDENGLRRNSIKNYNDDLLYPEDRVGLSVVAVYNSFDKSKCLWKNPKLFKREILDRLKLIIAYSKDNERDWDVCFGDDDNPWTKDIEVLDIVIDFIEKNYK